MTNITLYRDTTRDATCVEPADLDAFDGAWTDYVTRVKSAAETENGFQVRIAQRSAGVSYSVDDGNEDAHDLMQGIEFWT